MKYISPQKGYDLYYKEYKNDYKHLDSFDWEISRVFITQALKILIKSINPPLSINILDAGCGDGRVLKRVYNLCKEKINKINVNNKIYQITYNYTGIDISENMLKLAKKKVKEGHFFKLNLDSEHFIEEFTKNYSIFYHLIFSFFLLVHIKNPDIFFHNIYKLLNKDGYFIFNNIPQKSAPILSAMNKKFIIEHYNHTNCKIEKFLSLTHFKIIEKKEIYEKEKLISTLYLVKK